ncbi:MAG: hypothetical protein Tsb0034_24020 [Ekhidna sp.]
MRRLYYISFLFLGWLAHSQQLYVGGDALLHIGEGATVEVGGDLENAGAIQNIGTLSLYGDWTVNNNFNGLQGELKFLGGSNQTISPPELTISELTMNQGGIVSFPGTEYVVLDGIDLQFGIIEPGTETRFVLAENVKVIGGSNDSYFAGKLISKGSGIRQFPLGAEGRYSPLTLLNVFGVDTEISAAFTTTNDQVPLPSDTLIGVSDKGLWEVELVNGGTDASQVQLEFNGEDLSSFPVRNRIRHKVNSPVVAFATDPAGEFGSLGAEEILDSDSLTYGTIVSEYTIQPFLGEKIYFAVGLAPRIPNENLFYVPEIFSPNAKDPDNQSFKVFGENISQEDFTLTIYNRLGINVFSTNSFTEANKTGWSGNNQITGAEEPTGIYYYSLRLKFETGRVLEKSGAFYLVR